MASSSSPSCSGHHHQQNNEASHISEGEDTLYEIIRHAVADCLNQKWNRNIDVLINFQKEDTLANVTGILQGALLGQHVRVVINEEQDKIERSLICITVFSKEYASTKSCMLALDKILECRETNGLIVIPIFYGVKPSDLRRLAEILGDAFVEHLHNPKAMVAKAEKQKATLTEAGRQTSLTKASKLSGWVSMNIGSDAKLVEQTVKDILKKLVLISISMGDKLVTLFEMVLDKLDSNAGAFWNNPEMKQLHIRLREVHHLLQKARCYTFNQHRLLRLSFQNLRSHAYDIDDLIDGYEKSEVSKFKFDQEVRRIDGELVQFSYLFQNLVTSGSGERSAISECLSWQSPSPLPFIDCLSLSPGPATTINNSYNLSGHHNAQSLLLATSHKFSFDETTIATADKHSLNLSRQSSRTKKIVLALEINGDDRVQQRAVNIVCRYSGIRRISFDRVNEKMSIIGDVDAESVVMELRKLCSTEVVFLGEANEPEDEKFNKEDTMKADEKKKDAEIVERKPRKSSNWLYSCLCPK